MNKEEYERLYAERSGTTVYDLHAWGRWAVRCKCGDPWCEGWIMGYQWEEAITENMLWDRRRADG